MAEAAGAQEGRASRPRERQGSDCPRKPPRMQSCRHLDFSPQDPPGTSDLQSCDLRDGHLTPAGLCRGVCHTGWGAAGCWCVLGIPHRSQGQNVHAFPVGSGIPECFQHPCLYSEPEGFRRESSLALLGKQPRKWWQKSMNVCVSLACGRELTKWKKLVGELKSKSIASCLISVQRRDGHEDARWPCTERAPAGTASSPPPWATCFATNTLATVSCQRPCHHVARLHAECTHVHGHTHVHVWTPHIYTHACTRHTHKYTTHTHTHVCTHILHRYTHVHAYTIHHTCICI